MDPVVLEGSWVAVHVQSNMEKKVFIGLKERSYEPFLPLYRSQRRRFDRTVELDLPLFRGYVFCRWLHENRHPIVRVPGVVRIVGFGKIPACVHEDEIAAIRRIVDSRVLSMPWKLLRSGQRIKLVNGPLCGLEGLFVRISNADYIVVNLTLLGRSVAAKVHRDQIAACEFLQDELCANWDLPMRVLNERHTSVSETGRTRMDMNNLRPNNRRYLAGPAGG